MKTENQNLKIYLFYCSNSLDRDALVACYDHLESNKVKSISLPCSGKVDLLYLLKAFETGADGVILVTCGRKKCQNLEGNLRAQKRVQAVDSLLEETGAGKGRITAIQWDGGEIEPVIREITDFRAKIGKMVPLSKSTIETRVEAAGVSDMAEQKR